MLLQLSLHLIAINNKVTKEDKLFKVVATIFIQ